MTADEVKDHFDMGPSGCLLHNYANIAALVNAKVAKETERCRQICLRRSVAAAEQDYPTASLWLDATAQYISESAGEE